MYLNSSNHHYLREIIACTTQKVLLTMKSDVYYFIIAMLNQK